MRRLASSAYALLRSLERRAEKLRSVIADLEEKRLDEAKTKEEVREVRYSLYDEEGGKLTREQIQELHAAIDAKEAGFLKPAGKRRHHSR